MNLVAEIKTHSPFGFESKIPWIELFSLAQGYGDIISVHTHHLWGGSFEWLKTVRQRTKKPILAKGIHKTDDEVNKAFDFGADYVLVVGRIPQVSRMRDVWYEPRTLSEIDLAPPEINCLVWNARNLTDGQPKTETFEEAKSLWGGKICQASMIRSKDDVKDGADYILVGEGLKDYIKSTLLIP